LYVQRSHRVRVGQLERRFNGAACNRFNPSAWEHLNFCTGKAAEDSRTQDLADAI
jgi:hypothetical protein